MLAFQAFEMAAKYAILKFGRHRLTQIIPSLDILKSTLDEQE